MPIPAIGLGERHEDWDWSSIGETKLGWGVCFLELIQILWVIYGSDIETATEPHQKMQDYIATFCYNVLISTRACLNIGSESMLALIYRMII